MMFFVKIFARLTFCRKQYKTEIFILSVRYSDGALNMAAAPCLDGSTHPTVGENTRPHRQLYSDNILQNFNKHSVEKCTL